MRLLIYTTLSASPCSAREAQGTLTQGEEGKRGNGAWTRSSCKTGQMWPLMIPHAHSQPIAPTAHNVSIFMENDKGLSHLPVNTFHQNGIAFKISLFFSSSERAAAPKPTLLHTGLSHLPVTTTEQNFLFTVTLTAELSLCTYLPLQLKSYLLGCWVQSS